MASRLIPAVFAVFAAGASHALGFGDLILHSALNQPLDARVDLMAVKPSERASVEVRMAGEESFERFGVSRSPVLDDVRIRIIPSQDESRIRVRLSTERPVREPFLTFLLEADWAGGRALREYTVLLDPPVETPVARAPAPSRRAPQPAPTPAPAAAPEREIATPEPAPRAETTEPSWSPSPAGTIGVSRYGPIARNETLWSIARELRPDSRVSMNQMQMAIYRANPQAFNGNINRLMAGATLTIPTAEEVRAIDQGTARREIIEQQRAYESSRRSARSVSRTFDSSVSPDGPAAREEERALRLEPPSDDLIAEEDTGASLDAAETEDAGSEVPADNPVATAQSLAESGLAAEETVEEAEPDTTADSETGDDGAKESLGVAGDTLSEAKEAEKPAAKPKAVVPEGSDLPLSARNILLTLAVLLVAAVAFVWMRRRQYKPIPEDFSPRGDTRAEPAMEPAAEEKSEQPSLTPEEREEAVAEVLEDVDGYIQLELYDEALAALEVGLEKCPDEPALQRKMLEVHHANGDRDAFVAAAERYFPEPDDSDPEWWAVAAMGRELAPDESRFVDVQSPESGADAESADDSRADEEDEISEDAETPEEPEESTSPLTEPAAEDDEDTVTLDSDFPAIDESEEDETPAVEKTESTVDLDFDLDDEDSKAAAKEDEKEPTEAVPPALDVDLSEFTLDDKEDETAEEPAAEETKEPESAEEEDEFGDLDLDTLSLDSEEAGGAGDTTVEDLDKADEGAIDKPDFEAGEGLSLSEETPEEEAAEPEAETPEAEESDTADAELDEVTTNLDLARAYLDMGEPDMARSLLEEVKDQGNAEQRREAEELLERAG